MKKIIAIVVILIGTFLVSVGQQKRDTSATQHQAKKGNSQKGHGNDKVSKDKVGPNGEKVYIATDARYYWIDKKGNRHYVEELELKPKQ
jgi:FlaG/FlaF family flagellin (archaellin)